MVILKGICILLILVSFGGLSQPTITFDSVTVGKHKFYDWHGLPLLLVNRTPEQMKLLTSLDEDRKSIDYLKSFEKISHKYGNEVANLLLFTKDLDKLRGRSLDQKRLLLLGISVESLCRLSVTKQGLVDPCTGQHYDLSGRALGQYSNLLIPKYSLSNDSIVVESNIKNEEIVDFSPMNLNSILPIGKRVHELISWRKYDEALKYIKNDPLLLNYEDNQGRTPLFYLILRKKLALVKAYINDNINLNIVDQSGNTPLSIAIRINDIETINYLLMKGATKKSLCNQSSRFCSKEFDFLIKMYFPSFKEK
ncbi:hypothetical protein SOPP22_01335 [Shewanella sp. OPT22]|nr:hypothetical protein SOPP22_01335 [Shewanella sp. OPT22]